MGLGPGDVKSSPWEVFEILLVDFGLLASFGRCWCVLACSSLICLDLACLLWLALTRSEMMIRMMMTMMMMLRR